MAKEQSMGRFTGRSLILLLTAFLLAGALTACGKKSDVAPPEGEGASYTYPRVYPAPASVLPGAEDEETPRSRAAPVRAGGLTPFPSDTQTKTTYGSGAVQ